MANVIVPNKPAKDVIRIDDICYTLIGSTPNPPTHTNAEIQSLYDDCDACANDDLSSDSSAFNSSQSISSSSSQSSSSSSSFEISSENPCYHICVESDWTGADLNGTYTYNTVTEKWEQEGGDGTVFYEFDLGFWVIAHPSSGAVDDRVYDLEIAHTACPPLNGWTFVPAAGGTQSLLSVIDGTCAAVQSSDSSSQGFSSSSSSLGFSSSSSSSSSPDLSESSSQSGAVNACIGNDCGGSDRPNMQVKVEDPDYFLGDPSISWLGETWTPTQIQNGEVRCVCASVSNYDHVTTGQYPYHRWSINISAQNRLRMLRRVNTTNGYGINQLALGAPGYSTFSNSDFATWGAGTFTSFKLNFINAVPQPVAGPPNANFELSAAFFGSKTLGAVTYSWEQGINWP